MDDTQQTTQPTVNSQPAAAMPTMGDIAGVTTSPAMPTMPAGMVPGGDLTAPATGMTPPPASEPTMPVNPIPEPSVPTEPVLPTPSAPSEPTVPPMPEPSTGPMATETKVPTDAPSEATSAATMLAENADDYSYAEDILSEILDSLDRIEAKLEALEKKQG